MKLCFSDLVFPDSMLTGHVLVVLLTNRTSWFPGRSEMRLLVPSTSPRGFPSMYSFPHGVASTTRKPGGPAMTAAAGGATSAGAGWTTAAGGTGAGDAAAGTAGLTAGAASGDM